MPAALVEVEVRPLASLALKHITQAGGVLLEALKGIGLHRVATYTGDYRWLCKLHYEAWQPRIPDEIKA